MGEGFVVFVAVLLILTAASYKYLPKYSKKDPWLSRPYRSVSSRTHDYIATQSSAETEWPVLVETNNNPYLIHTLTGILEDEGIPFLLNEEVPEMGGVANILLRDRLRVPEENQEEASQTLRTSGIDTEHFIFFDEKNE